MSTPKRKRAAKPATVTVVTTGEVIPLAPRVETGMGPCPGEAHRNAFIDNCSLCAPGCWGEVMTYAPPTPEMCQNGFAVPCGSVTVNGREARNPFLLAEDAGLIEMAAVRTKNSSFMVWMATGCTAHEDCKKTPELGRACKAARDAAKEA